MSMDWMIPRRTVRRSEFVDEWRINAMQIANAPPPQRAAAGDVAAGLISASKNLKVAWDHLARYGGDAAGPNRQTFADFTRVGTWREI